MLYSYRFFFIHFRPRTHFNLNVDTFLSRGGFPLPQGMRKYELLLNLMLGLEKK